MFVFRHLDMDEGFETIEEVMNKIKSLQKEGKMNHQFVVVEKEGRGCLEIALGMGNESVLFYTPESEEEDCKISCNETVERAKSDPLTVSDIDGEKLMLSKSNTVELEEAYKIVEAYLSGEDFTAFADWYVF